MGVHLRRKCELVRFDRLPLRHEHALVFGHGALDEVFIENSVLVLSRRQANVHFRDFLFQPPLLLANFRHEEVGLARVGALFLFGDSLRPLLPAPFLVDGVEGVAREVLLRDEWVLVERRARPIQRVIEEALCGVHRAREPGRIQLSHIGQVLRVALDRDRRWLLDLQLCLIESVVTHGVIPRIAKVSLSHPLLRVHLLWRQMRRSPDRILLTAVINVHRICLFPDVIIIALLLVEAPRRLLKLGHSVFADLLLA